MGNSWIRHEPQARQVRQVLCVPEQQQSPRFILTQFSRDCPTPYGFTQQPRALCVQPTQSNSHCLTCSKLSICFILNRCNNHKVLITLELLSAHEHVWLCVMCLCKNRVWDNKHRTSNCTGMTYNNQGKVYEDDISSDGTQRGDFLAKTTLHIKNIMIFYRMSSVCVTIAHFFKTWD